MNNHTNSIKASAPVSLHQHAEDNLQYIRNTMESSISFTGIFNSVSIIPVMGALFIVVGALVLFTPLPANTTLGLGLGILHIVFGIIVWRKYGG